MSDEKRRLVLFVLLSFLLVTGTPVLLEKLGLAPRNPPAARDQPDPAAVARKDDDAEEAGAGLELPANVFADAGKAGDAAAPPAVKPAEIALVEPAQLVLGPKDVKAPEGYLLQLHLTQKGAGVDSLFSTKYEAEWKDRKNNHAPLALLQHDSKTPPSLLLKLLPPEVLDENKDDDPRIAIEKLAARRQYELEDVTWEVVRDRDGKVVREATPRTPGSPSGQEIRFRTAVGKDGPGVVKRYRLYPGEPAFDLIVELETAGVASPIAYSLSGPHGIPIEGEWYTSTFRDLVVAQRESNDAIKLIKVPGTSTIAQAKDEDQPRFSEHPLAFAGVENQYFAVLVKPVRGPDNPAGGWVAETKPASIEVDAENAQQSDISFELTSKPELVNPGHPESHEYRVFAGPKIYDVLKPFGAQDLATYRKGWSIPGIGDLATILATNVIAPLLNRIYALTEQVGGGKGSYGIAIILLTMTVRMMLFPLGRKAAIAAKKMQALQPLVSEIREKHKGDNEKILKEQQALYRRHNVNMFGGCLPAMIQLPIFIGLWQTLNNSVALRHASFLWIQNLAAPDMLLRFPAKIPYIGDYFNLLPFVVVGLMLVQNKLFMPPATTPEAEMQQKMMKYMMVFMAFMFYRVPSGLGLYFITSSLWAICERLLLPKVMHTPPPLAAEEESPDGGKGGPGGKEPARPGGGGGGGGWLSKKLEALLEEAANQKTIRNDGNANGNVAGPGPGRDGDRNRPGPGKARPKPRRR